MTTSFPPAVFFLRHLSQKVAVPAIAIPLLAVFSVTPVKAAEFTWAQAAGTNSWNASANWAPATGFPNAAGDIADLTNAITAASVVNLNQNITLGSLNIGDASGKFVFNVSPGTSGSLTFNNNGAGASINVDATSKGDTISAPVTLADNLAISSASSNLFTMTGSSASVTTGTVAIIGGTGNLTFNANSSGGITLSSTSTSVTSVVNNAGSITNSGVGSGTVTIQSNIGTNVTGIVENSASSQLTLSGSNAFTSGIAIKSGAVSLSNSNAGGAGAITLGNTSGSANASLLGGNSVTFANTINVAAGSSGTLVLGVSAGSPSFTGAINLSNNLTLETTLSGGLGVSGAVTGTGNITMLGSKTGGATTPSITLSGSINNVGTITNMSTGSVFVLISGSLGSNITNVAQMSTTSMLVLSGSVASYGTTTIGSGATLLLGGTVAGGGNLASFGTGDIDDEGTIIVSQKAAPTISNAISGAGAVVQSGTGTTVLSGSNSYSGGTTVNAGTLRVGSANALGSSTGSVVLNGGILDLAGNSITVGSLSGSSGSIITNTSPVVLSTTLAFGAGSGTATFAGVVQNDLASPNRIIGLNKVGAGTEILSGMNTYTGVTTVSAGTLLVSGGLSSSTAVTVAAGATLGLGQSAGGSFASQSVATLNTGLSANIALSLGNAGNNDALTTGAWTLNGPLNLVLTDTTLAGGISSLTGSYTLMIWTSGGIPNTAALASDLTLNGSSSDINISEFSVVGDSLVFTAAAVPEPATWALLGLGLTAAGVLHRKKKRN